ncbi:hypothetical protein CDD83_9308 [Cordyceps sp. RAO-2017]|nr:hypothetical protein CDD83_9308 [Cordyceps sp. RAO-2017]
MGQGLRAIEAPARGASRWPSLYLISRPSRRFVKARPELCKVLRLPRPPYPSSCQRLFKPLRLGDSSPQLFSRAPDRSASPHPMTRDAADSATLRHRQRRAVIDRQSMEQPRTQALHPPSARPCGPGRLAFPPPPDFRAAVPPASIRLLHRVTGGRPYSLVLLTARGHDVVPLILGPGPLQAVFRVAGDGRGLDRSAWLPPL